MPITHQKNNQRTPSTLLASKNSKVAYEVHRKLSTVSFQLNIVFGNVKRYPTK